MSIYMPKRIAALPNVYAIRTLIAHTHTHTHARFNSLARPGRELSKHNIVFSVYITKWDTARAVYMYASRKIEPIL
jgi:hypothetical protein